MLNYASGWRSRSAATDAAQAVRLTGQTIAAAGPRALLEQAGLALEPLPEGEDWTPGLVQISDEMLGELPGAGDLILIVSDVEADAGTDPYAGNPLWQQLPAVQDGRVHPRPGHAWTNYGPLALLRVLDEATAALSR